MENKQVISANIYEALALRKAILMLKFNKDTTDISHLLGSKFLYDFLVRLEAVVKPLSVNPTEVYPIDDEGLGMLKQYIKSYEVWDSLSDDSKRDLVKMMAFPLYIEDTLLDELVKNGGS